jgi:hypothetical protein
LNPQLYGLQVDFMTGNGHYMVLSADGGMKREQLSPFQVNMLLSNKIPHLLDLQVEERDQQVKLYYNITGKRMLTHWLRMSSINIKQFFSLLYAIVDIIGESNVYMLQEGRYILIEDYIYCGEDLTDVHLTYIPKEVLTEKNALSVDLQHLASRLIHKVSELSGSGYQELMNYLMEESFNIPVLKQLLQKHRTRIEQTPDQTISQQAKKYDPQPKAAPYQAPDPTSHQTSHQAYEQNTYNSVHSSSANPPPAAMFTSGSAAGIPRAGTAPAAPLFSAPAFSPSWFEEDDQQEVVERNNKLKLPVLLVGLLAVGLIWKLYVDQPNEGWLFVCSGLSLLVLDIVFIVLRIWKPGIKGAEPVTWASVHQELTQERQEHASVLPFFTPKPEEPSRNPVNSVDVPGIAAGSGTRLESKLDSLRQNPEASQEAESYYHTLEQRTTLLTPMDATVLLSASSLQHGVKAARPYLEWNLDGAVKMVRIEKSPFVIGRMGQGVDFGHQETGVSRIHAEITIENDQNMLKDLGSRNGTFINGEIMVPYRMYSLQEGDIVKLISTEFVFKMGL